MARGLQKQQAQAKAQAGKGKSEVDRKAAQKQAAKDSQAFVCGVCRQTFSNTAKAML